MILDEALREYSDFDEKIVMNRNGKECGFWTDNDEKYKAEVICVVPHDDITLEIMIDYL